jgi:hypothetical protein
MPTIDQTCDAGAVARDLYTIQTRNAHEASGRMPIISASPALLKTLRR